MPKIKTSHGSHSFQRLLRLLKKVLDNAIENWSHFYRFVEANKSVKPKDVTALNLQTLLKGDFNQGT